MAQESVKTLNLMMQGKKTKVEKVTLPAELVIRESCQSLKSA
ncbi:MAG: LacI family transcriptional regulator, partial [Candidatus Omnitrophica bacterium]|nr:LacI family transcriptional regulator [Candidatus Omnitrophota bacterium]